MKICDAHNDFLTEIKSKKERTLYIKNLENNNQIFKISSVVWTTKFDKPLKNIYKLKNEIARNNLKNKLILSLEDLGFISKYRKYDYVIKKIIKLKPTFCGLVWNEDNLLGGGAFGKKGLSKLGKKTIRILESNNIIIDTAHMNQKTFNDFAKITDFPIYNSHSNLYYFKAHSRNLKPIQIKKIIESKGFIGLSFVCDFISNKEVDSKLIAKQLAYFVHEYGSDNIGLGTDFYGTKNLPKDLLSYKNIKNLIIELKKLNIQNKIINKILYKNFLDFLKRLKKLYYK